MASDPSKRLESLFSSDLVHVHEWPMRGPRCQLCNAVNGTYGFDPMPNGQIRNYPTREPLHYCAKCYRKALNAWPFKVRL